MPRVTALFACVVGVVALTVGLARAEYDSGGSPTNPAQMQANRPKVQVQRPFDAAVLEQDIVFIKMFLQPQAKPAPAKKSLPKPPGKPRQIILTK